MPRRELTDDEQDAMGEHLAGDGAGPGPAMGGAIRLVRHRFGADPEAEFSPGGMLEGFSSDGDYATDAATVEASGVPLSEEDVVGRLPDERLAVVGLTVEGHPFWVEETLR